MSQYDFTLRTTVDADALREHNKKAAETRTGIAIPDDPRDWDENDVLIALNEEIATALVLEATGPR
jgi:hypothetical protein